MEGKSGRFVGRKASVGARISLAILSAATSVALAWLLLGSSYHNAQAISPPNIRETLVPGNSPWGLGFDNKGNIWVALPACDPTPICGSIKQGSIAVYTRQGFSSSSSALQVFPEPANFSSPVYLAADSSGNIWFTEPTTNSIGELIPNIANPNSSTWNQWRVPSNNAPFDLTFDRSGNLWFTEVLANEIGFFSTTNHTFVETSTPTGNSKPYGITGPDPTTGDIWFTENNSAVAKIGRFTPTASGSLNNIQEYKTNSGSNNATPHDLTFDNQGNIWWSEGFDGEIGRLIINQASNGTSNGVNEFLVPCAPSTATPATCPGMHISGIGVDSTGTVWFDDSLNSRIGSFVPGSNTFSMYTVNSGTTSNSHPHDGLAVDGNNNIWFVEEFANKLGEAIQTGIPNPTPSPTLALPPTILPSFPPGQVNKTWYFAEGRVGKGFKEYLTLGNPSSTTPCIVSIQYMLLPDGGSPGTRTISVTVSPDSRVTQYVNNDLSVPQSQATGVSVSALVQVNSTATPNCNGIVAERPMYFNALGVNSGDDVMGATHAASSFYFADVPTGGGYSSFITILNPGNSPATVTATYYAGGTQVGTQMTTVAPNARGTISPNNRGLPGHVAAVVSSTQPIVVERPDYFRNINGGNAGTISGAAVVVGTSALANDWLLAEGYTGTHYQEKLVIANLDRVANTTANVTIQLDFATGGARTFKLSLARLSQVIWDVNAAVGPNQAVSAEVLATGANIVVEREMFFQSSFTVNNVSSVAMGGSEVNGQVGPASHSSYSFAEGYTNTGYKEWLTLQNPTANAETVYVTLVNGYGRTYTQAFNASAHSRTTVDINGLVVAHLLQSGDKYPGYEVSMTVQTLNGAPFVAERPMYWNAGGTQGGSVALGYIGG